METSTLNGANGTLAQGIVPLSMNEIEMVAGGKAAQTIWERLLAWAEGIFTNPPANAGGITLTLADIGYLQDACVKSGGNFTFDGGAGAAGLRVRVVGADATYSWVTINCTQP